MPDDSILCFINRCMNMWDIEPAKLVLIFLRQNLLYILANFWDVLPHQPAFSWAIWKVSTTHGKLRTSAWWPAYWLNEILQKQLRYDFSNIAHFYFWESLKIKSKSIWNSLKKGLEMLANQFKTHLDLKLIANQFEIHL